MVKLLSQLRPQSSGISNQLRSKINFRIELNFKTLAQAMYKDAQNQNRIERFYSNSWEKEFLSILDDKLPIKLKTFINSKLKIEIILDGGIRRGTHVLKALALGATACSMGKAYLYGLSAGGQAGVERVLQKMKDEITRGMTLMGARKVQELTKDKIAYR